MAAKPFVLRTSEDVLCALPVVFGFHPSESICMISVGAVEGMAMHARLDLPTTPESRGEGAQALSEAASRNSVRSVLLVSYGADVEQVEAMALDLEVALLSAGVTVVDHLWVLEGRYRTAGPNGFIPAEGVPFDVDSHPLMAEQVFAGKPVPAADRESMVATLHGTPDPVESLSKALGRLMKLADDEAMAGESQWMQERVRQFCDDGEHLDHADAARLMAGMTLSPLRDVVMGEVDRKRTATAMVNLLTNLTSRAQGHCVAYAAAMLAFAAWQEGNGAWAWAAVNRARAVDPSNNLAGLVAAALEGSVPPHVWQKIEPGHSPGLGGDAKTN